MSYRTLFMGTPDFGLPTLIELHQSKKFEVVGVVCQPDPEKRRSRKANHQAIKAFALENQIPIHQPASLRKKKFDISTFTSLNLDFILVAAYGKILPKRILSIPKYGCINLHGSLLPLYRGAAPVQWAVINGEKYSGNTIMLMSEGLDEGDILSWDEHLIQEDMTSGELYQLLSEKGGALVAKTLVDYAENRITPLVQDHHFATIAPKITAKTGIIDFKRSAPEIHNLVRGLSPFPTAETTFRGEKVKICRTTVILDCPDKWKGQKIFGSLIGPLKKELLVQTGDGVLKIDRLKPAGKREMNGSDFLNGFRVTDGEHFGDYFET